MGKYKGGNNAVKNTVEIAKNEMPRKLKVTTLEELKEYADKGATVELAPFADGVPFVAQLKRPSLLGLIAQDVIPNPLQTLAIKMFEGENDLTQDMKDVHEVLSIFAKECLVSPSYEELESIGLELTDEQLIFIFNYGTTGVRVFEKFRVQQQFSELVKQLSNVQKNSSRNAGNK